MHSQSWDYRHMPTYLASYGDPNTEAHAVTAGTLPTEPPTHPQHLLFTEGKWKRLACTALFLIFIFYISHCSVFCKYKHKQSSSVSVCLKLNFQHDPSTDLFPISHPFQIHTSTHTPGPLSKQIQIWKSHVKLATGHFLRYFILFLLLSALQLSTVSSRIPNISVFFS